MFVTEEYVINGFDMYDEHNSPVGCYFDQLRLTRSGGKHIISYELWFNNHREVVTRKFKDLWSTSDLDLMLQEVMEKMFGESKENGYVYYDVDLIAA